MAQISSNDGKIVMIKTYLDLSSGAWWRVSDYLPLPIRSPLWLPGLQGFQQDVLASFSEPWYDYQIIPDSKERKCSGQRLTEAWIERF